MISYIERIIIELGTDLIHVDSTVTYVEEFYPGIPKRDSIKVAYAVIEVLVKNDLVEAKTYDKKIDTHLVENNKAKVLGIIKHHFDTDNINGMWFDYILYAKDCKFGFLAENIFQGSDWQNYGKNHFGKYSLYEKQSVEKIISFEVAKLKSYLLMSKNIAGDLNGDKN